MPFDGLPVAIGKAAPADKAHHACAIEQQDRSALAAYRLQDRFQRRIVNVVRALRAEQLVGELIERGLLARPLVERVGGALLFRDVARDLGGTDDAAAAIAHRRNGEGDVHQRSVLALTDRLVMIDALAAAEARHNAGLFVLALLRDQRE